ncbi:MAG: asparagine synthase (glutamine-hydrolyzing) [Chloroflexi bacterium]|nr:asparagine synthase (glutamine-hydrolyzing) [Chloroflexota bacterium]MCY3958961.1 asparagine synthase (glutamine-hydrolyzing) [Chloroflexota bacterium]
MCGIAGAWIWDSDRSARADVTAATKAMAHRGPDGGAVVDLRAPYGTLALGARRLAVQDLSARGAQPMCNPQTGSVIVFNGEVYNFRELRRQLSARGHTFRTGTDTEVVLHGYDEWGVDCLERFAGMFAFAIWDARAGRLVLARDRLGVKPLYTAVTGSQVAFASEIRAMLAGGFAEPRLSPAGLAGYLSLGAAREPGTLIEGVDVLPPGTAREFNGRTFQTRRYWDLREQVARRSENSLGRATAADAVRQRLGQAVQRRLVSDAPLGVLLSGGIDSATVTALAARDADRPLRTVSAVFDDPCFSERDAMRASSAQFGTEHVETILGPEDARDSLDALFAAMDQPTFDGLNIYLVAQAARGAGLTAVLSGIGGDEVFGGYPSFRIAPWLRRVRRFVPPQVGRIAGAGLRRTAPVSSRIRRVDGWLARSDPTLPAELATRQLFSRTEIQALTSTEAQAFDPAPPAASPFNRVAFAEMDVYMRNVLLRDTDVMGMAQGLEIREPLLDHELVETVLALGDDVKRRGPGPKPLLARALGRELPPHALRRKKQGFSLPLDQWMRGALRSEVESVMRESSMGGPVGDALDPDVVASMWNEFLAGRRHWTAPWAIYVAKRWGDGLWAGHALGV